MDAIRIGWLGSALDGPDGGYDKIHRLAFDEAAEAGLLDRPVEFGLTPENGLPRGSAKNATDGFRFLVDEGCIGVAGAYSSDNAITVGPLANELQIPLISWCGTERLQGDYCFRLGNGDCGGDAALVVGWLKKHGHTRVAVLSEISPNGEEYFRFFRQECRRHGISIAAVETVSQSPENLATNLDNLRQVGPDALVYMGYGMLAANGLLREALDKLGWDPPRIMGTAFMFYLMGFDKFEGWVGDDRAHRHRPLHDHLGRRSRGRRAARLPAVPRVEVARRVRCVGRVVHQPVLRSARVDRVPQLGQRAAPRRDHVARRHRGGAVSEHHPAVLRAEQPHRVGADRRRLREAVGGAAGAQPLARRLLCGRAGPARRLRASVP